LENRLMALFTVQTVRAGLGTISEVFDGDSPHEPRGCIAQAWSVAEPLRAYLEDLLGIRPQYEKEVLRA
jgi:glycogen debranching enzyme